MVIHKRKKEIIPNEVTILFDLLELKCVVMKRRIGFSKKKVKIKLITKKSCRAKIASLLVERPNITAFLLSAGILTVTRIDIPPAIIETMTQV